MSNILKQLQRDPKFQKQPQPPAPAPADTNGLGVAIQQLIDQAVQTQVADAVEKQKPPVNPAVPKHLQEFTSEPFRDSFPPAPPKAKQPMPVITMTRGADGKIRSASVGTMTFNVERDGAGRAMRLVPQED